MAEKLDYAHLGFAYHVPEKRYVSNYRNGAWDKGCLSEDSNVVLNESAGILQYCQQVFEGMKAYRWKDGSIVCFRPDLNAERMFQSAAFLEMPGFPVERFLSALDEVVRANATVPFCLGHCHWGAAGGGIPVPYLYDTGRAVF